MHRQIKQIHQGAQSQPHIMQNPDTLHSNWKAKLLTELIFNQGLTHYWRKKNSVFSKETFWCKSVHFNGPKVYFLEEIRLYTTTHKSTTVNSATELITQSQCSLKFWYMFPNLSSQSSPYQSTTWALRQSPSPTLANSGESAHSINLLKTSQTPPRLWSAFTGMPLELFPTFLATWVCSFACYLFRSSACFSRMGVFFCLSSQICWGVCLLVCGLIM